MTKKIYLATDHAGFELKERLKAYLLESGHDVTDFGADSYDKGDDYPDFIKPLAEKITKSSGDKVGIIFGLSGQGEAMTANRYKKVRAIEYYGGNLGVIKLAREHNDANVLSIGAGFIMEDELREAVGVFLGTSFSGAGTNERHLRRIKKMDS